MDEYLDIPYVASQPQSPFQTFDIYVPKERETGSLCPLICFVHGGAWRSGDKSDHATFARRLALSTGYPVAVPNYRLSPGGPSPESTVRHPEHAKDILHFLEFICTAPDPRSDAQNLTIPAESYADDGGATADDSRKIPGLPYQPQRLLLLGHSCAAHMLCTIFLHMPESSSSHGCQVCPSEVVLARTASLVLSEGIYDIDALLSNFPTYRRWFVEDAFGAHDSYADVSMTNAATRSGCGHIQWLIIHSKGDILVDEQQSQGAYDHLRSQAAQLCKSFDEFFDGHDDILRGNQFVEIVHRHIQKVVAGLE